MFKFLWLDTETTGLDPVKNDIIQVAGIIVVGGSEEKFNFKIRPESVESISPEAERIHGISKEEMMKFPKSSKVYNEFKNMLKEYVNPYDKTDKYILSGQNVQFDCNFVEQWFKKNHDPYWFSWVGYSQFDLKNLIILHEMREKKRIYKSHKLTAVCDKLGVTLSDAHDALADIEATREACQIIWSKFI